MSRSEADVGGPAAIAGRRRLGGVEPIGKLSLLPGSQARHHVKRALDGLGCRYETVRFSTALRLPVTWQVQVMGSAPGSGGITIPSAAAVGSRTCREVEGAVTYVGTGAPTEYELGGAGYRGRIVLATLGTVPTREIIPTAHDHGALAVLLYHPHASSVQAVAPGSLLPLPVATIGRGAATALARAGGRVRLTVESEDRELSFENIFVRCGDGPLHVLVASHYDSRPLRLGPGGRSMGLAVALSLLAAVQPRADRRFTFALMDGEEFGSVGSTRYYEDVRSEVVEPPDLVVDLNALGTRRELGLEVQQPRGDGSGLRDFAVQAFEAAGLRLVPRDLDRIFYGGARRPRVEWPVVGLGGRPRRRVPCGDPEQGLPDRWGVRRLVGPITTILHGARP